MHFVEHQPHYYTLVYNLIDQKSTKMRSNLQIMFQYNSSPNKPILQK